MIYDIYYSIVKHKKKKKKKKKKKESKRKKKTFSAFNWMVFVLFPGR